MNRIVAGSRPGSVLVRFSFSPGLVPLLVLVLGGNPSWSAHVLPGAQVNCSQQGLTCTFSSSECSDPGWLVSHSYTPSGPEQIQVKISTKPDLSGNLLPVLDVTWILKDDGSISSLTATQLHVLVASTNQNLCLRYSFREKLSMRNPRGDKWRFSADQVVVEPGQIYKVSVENIPKPELNHSNYDVSQEVTVPDCREPVMAQTQPCVDTGSLFRPNISLSQISGSSLRILFSPDLRSQRYIVLCRCGTLSKTQHTAQNNVTQLSASFDLDHWPRSCCLFNIEVKPFFPRCGNDCERHRSTFNICPPVPTPGSSSEEPPAAMPLLVGGSCLLLLSVVIGVCTALVCRKRGRQPPPDPEVDPLLQTRLKDHPRLLLIYSRDHPLHRDVVLKLCAFLQAQCGIVVLLDLLDSASVAQVGLMRWLEIQRQKLRPSDKILVLCSRGVQAKWKSMCGHGPPTVYRPDDLIGPFLSLFLSDMHLPGSMGRYIAAYIEDISSEQDVPSFFDIAVKYKLMKHFEELYFRILDMEKYEPSRVNHIEGIGPDEYFRCDTGNLLRNAIETFHAFQISNPDWFENGEEISNEVLSTDIDLPLLECVPVIKKAPSIFSNNVYVNENVDNFFIVNPELNPLTETSIFENRPVPDLHQRAGLQPIYELSPTPQTDLEISSVCPVIQVPIELHSQEVSVSRNGIDSVLVVDLTDPRHEGGDEGRRSEPVEMEEEMEEEMESANKNQNSGSDQGYMSKTSTDMDSDDLKALLSLQRELMQGHCPFEME